MHGVIDTIADNDVERSSRSSASFRRDMYAVVASKGFT